MLKEKLFIIKKTIMAKSVLDAVRREKGANVDEVYVDPDWAKMNMGDENKRQIGFKNK